MKRECVLQPASHPGGIALNSERTKPCPIANEKAMTSRSNRLNEFLRPAGFDDSKWRASGTQLAAKIVDLEVYGCLKYDARG